MVLADNQCGFQLIGHKSHNAIKMTVNGGDSELGILPGIFFGGRPRLTAFAGSHVMNILADNWLCSRDSKPNSIAPSLLRATRVLALRLIGRLAKGRSLACARVDDVEDGASFKQLPAACCSISQLLPTFKALMIYSALLRFETWSLFGHTSSKVIELSF